MGERIGFYFLEELVFYMARRRTPVVRKPRPNPRVRRLEGLDIGVAYEKFARQSKGSTQVSFERFERATILLGVSDYSIRQICSMLRMDYRSLKKIMKATNVRTKVENDRISFRTGPKLDSKKQLELIRLGKETKLTEKEIAEILSIDSATVRKHIKKSNARSEETRKKIMGAARAKGTRKTSEREKAAELFRERGVFFGVGDFVHSLDDVGARVKLSKPVLASVAKDVGRLAEDNRRVYSRRVSEKNRTPTISHLLDLLSTRLLGSVEMIDAAIEFDRGRGAAIKPRDAYKGMFGVSRKVLGLNAFPRSSAEREKQARAYFKRTISGFGKKPVTLEMVIAQRDRVLTVPITRHFFEEWQKREEATPNSQSRVARFEREVNALFPNGVSGKFVAYVESHIGSTPKTLMGMHSEEPPGLTVREVAALKRAIEKKNY